MNKKLYHIRRILASFEDGRVVTIAPKIIGYSLCKDISEYKDRAIRRLNCSSVGISYTEIPEFTYEKFKLEKQSINEQEMDN